MVKVTIVDEHPTSWMLHESLLVANCGYARNVLSSSLEAETERSLRLSTGDKGSFGIFVRFLQR